MTAREIFLRAESFLTQTQDDAQDMVQFVPELLNVILAECLKAENQLRRLDGMQQLAEAPQITEETLDEIVPYHDDLTRVAMPYGLAVHLWREDDNDYRANLFQQMYVNAIGEASSMMSEEIEDVYGGGDA